MTRTSIWVSLLMPLALVACHDYEDAPARTPAVTEAVPAGASTNATTATTYTSQLASTPSSQGDALEPVTVPDQLATDDTAEPTT